MNWVEFLAGIGTASLAFYAWGVIKGRGIGATK